MDAVDVAPFEPGEVRGEFFGDGAAVQVHGAEAHALRFQIGRRIMLAARRSGLVAAYLSSMCSKVGAFRRVGHGPGPDRA